jgi:hypothetical protein
MLSKLDGVDEFKIRTRIRHTRTFDVELNALDSTRLRDDTV